MQPSKGSPGGARSMWSYLTTPSPWQHHTLPSSKLVAESTDQVHSADALLSSHAHSRGPHLQQYPPTADVATLDADVVRSVNDRPDHVGDEGGVLWVPEKRKKGASTLHPPYNGTPSILGSEGTTDPAGFLRGKDDNKALLAALQGSEMAIQEEQLDRRGLGALATSAEGGVVDLPAVLEAAAYAHTRDDVSNLLLQNLLNSSEEISPFVPCSPEGPLWGAGRAPPVAAPSAVIAQASAHVFPSSGAVQQVECGQQVPEDVRGLREIPRSFRAFETGVDSTVRAQLSLLQRSLNIRSHSISSTAMTQVQPVMAEVGIEECITPPLRSGCHLSSGVLGNCATTAPQAPSFKGSSHGKGQACLVLAPKEYGAAGRGILVSAHSGESTEHRVVRQGIGSTLSGCFSVGDSQFSGQGGALHGSTGASAQAWKGGTHLSRGEGEWASAPLTSQQAQACQQARTSQDPISNFTGPGGLPVSREAHGNVWMETEEGQQSYGKRRRLLSVPLSGHDTCSRDGSVSRQLHSSTRSLPTRFSSEALASSMAAAAEEARMPWLQQQPPEATLQSTTLSSVAMSRAGVATTEPLHLEQARTGGGVCGFADSPVHDWSGGATPLAVPIRDAQATQDLGAGITALQEEALAQTCNERRGEEEGQGGEEREKGGEKRWEDEGGREEEGGGGKEGQWSRGTCNEGRSTGALQLGKDRVAQERERRHKIREGLTSLRRAIKGRGNDAAVLEGAVRYIKQLKAEATNLQRLLLSKAQNQKHGFSG